MTDIEMLSRHVRYFKYMLFLFNFGYKSWVGLEGEDAGGFGMTFQDPFHLVVHPPSIRSGSDRQATGSDWPDSIKP